MKQLTASEMAKKGHKNRTPKSYADAAKKGAVTMMKKYGKEYFYHLRMGTVDKYLKDQQT